MDWIILALYVLGILVIIAIVSYVLGGNTCKIEPDRDKEYGDFFFEALPEAFALTFIGIPILVGLTVALGNHLEQMF